MPKNNNGSLFITGTDTGVGKTIVTSLLARHMIENGLRVATQKWVQTGCRQGDEDVLVHMKHMGWQEPSQGLREDLVPYRFMHPSSPHLAAKLENSRVDTSNIVEAYNKLTNRYDHVIIEGSGGILVPLNEDRTTADLIEELSLPVLVVAGNRLGAINQTLLTLEALSKRVIDVLGVVFNRTSEGGDDIILGDNLRIVEKISGARVLGELPYSEDIDALYGAFRPIGRAILEIGGLL